MPISQLGFFQLSHAAVLAGGHRRSAGTDAEHARHRRRDFALGTLAATVNSLSGDSNTLTSLVVSAIPVGATLSDGYGHSFTASAGTTSVNVSGWTLSSLTVTPTNDTDFTLTATATTSDANGHTSTANITEAVTVDPLAPTLSWAPSSVSINHAHDAKAYALGALHD